MPGRILSVQSHVAFGYVGGKAAVFPLQCLGYDVDVVNTVNFSNHSGYGHFGGTKTSPQELSQIFDLMEENGLLSPSRLLTGYIPGAEALIVIAQLAEKLRANNPDLIYLLDPVMGDAGKLYVAPEVVPIYRSLLPLATIITPNWFEVETLTQVQLNDIAGVRRALAILHQEYRVPHVVISSMPVRREIEGVLPKDLRLSSEGADQSLICIASSLTHSSNPGDISTVHAYCLPCLPGYFSGVGDLFSALVLAHFERAPATPSRLADQQQAPEHAPQSEKQTPLSHAASKAMSKTFAILQLTSAHASSLPLDERTLTDEELDRVEPGRKVRRMRGRELRIVQGQDIIREERGSCKTRWMVPWERFWEN